MTKTAPAVSLVAVSIAACLLLAACEQSAPRRRSLMNFQPVRSPEPGLVGGEVPRDMSEKGADAWSYKVPKRDLYWVTHGVEMEGNAVEYQDPWYGPGSARNYREYQEYYPSTAFRVPSNEPVVDQGGGQMLGVDVRIGRTIVSPEGDTVSVRVRVTAPTVKAARGDGTNFAIVLDYSESMRSPEKLALLRASAHYMIDQVLAGDRVSLVVLGDEVAVPLSLSQSFDRHALHALVDRLDPRGDGQLASALDAAYGDMEAVVQDTGEAAHIVLLTDGQSARGATGAWRLVNMAVGRHARKGVRLNIVGIGHQLDTSFLTELARAGEGQFAYVQSREEVAEVLDRELETMLHVFARNVLLKVRNLKGGLVHGIQGLEFATPQEGVDQVSLGDFVDGEQRSLLITLQFPPSNDGNFFETDLRLSFQHASTARRNVIERSFRVRSAELRQKQAEDEFVAAYRQLILGLEQIRLAVDSRSNAAASVVTEMLENEFPALQKTALKAADRDLVHHAQLFERFAVKLRSLATQGKLTGESIEREEFARELIYRRYASRTR